MEVALNCPVKMGVNWSGGREFCADTVAAEEATTAAKKGKNEEACMLVWKVDAEVDIEYGVCVGMCASVHVQPAF